MTAESGPAGVKETARVEAFSDGVFAIAITLLVLELKVPHARELEATGGRLVPALLAQWPSYFAYLTSFLMILVMWVNHHMLFTHIRRTSQPFLYLNGLLLLVVTFVPFPTALLAEYVERPEAPVAAAIYAGTSVVLAIAFNLLWRHASGAGRLLDGRANATEVAAITRQYLTGPVLYFLALVLAFVWVPASVGLCLALGIYFALTGSLNRVFVRRRRDDAAGGRIG